MTEEKSAVSAPSFILRVALVAVAAIETTSAVSDFDGIFHDYGHTDPLVIFAQRAGNIYLALAPVLAGAALVLAGLGQLRLAIAALALRMLASWLSDLPDIAIHGLELSASFGGAQTFAMRFVLPAIAVAALVLAQRNERLGLATFLVSLPTAANWLMVAAFIIGVMIYGF